ncbi:MAG TPA: hypothetical protein PLN48_13605 [Lachnospiraceae bacterium]|nr:hypothetical protein [Lachnospiraceae bacterium]
MRSQRSRIPCPAKPISEISRIPKINVSVDNGIIFSFERLEKNDYFNIDCACERWSVDLFQMFKDISQYTPNDFYSGKLANSKFRIHTHEKAKPPCKIPEDIDLSSFYQIRIEEDKGGIHGVLVDNIFYVVWLDPLHNMYPNSMYGGARKIKQGQSCCEDGKARLLETLEENQRLKTENETYADLFEAKAAEK